MNVLKQKLEKALAKNKDELDDANSSISQTCKECLGQLDQVDMNMDVLTTTLIGVTVNKFKSNPSLGESAKLLIKKWKQIASKEQPPGKTTQSKKAKGQLGDSSNGKQAEKKLESMQKIWSHLSSSQQKICEKLYDMLCLARGNLISAGMNGDAIDECLANTAVEIEAAIQKSFRDKKAYTEKARSLAFNLKNNVQLSQDLVFGATQCDELVHMSAEQLASSELRRQRQEQAQKLIDSKRLDWEQANEDKINEMCGIKGDLLKASLFTCGRCKSVKTTSTQKQTRSADEPMTVFVLCLNCGNRWKC